jgi:DNA-binding transcriptional regulator YdaS (Cro superfamily)
MDLFTEIEPKSQKTRGRGACEAGGGGTVADLVAMVERMAVERRSVNQIVAAVRAFSAQRATL